MLANLSADAANGVFTLETVDEFAVLKMGPRAFDLVTELGPKRRLLDILSQIEHSSTLKGVVVMNSIDYAGFSRYRDFLPVISGKVRGATCDRSQLLTREENALGQFAVAAASFGKLTIAALQGNITTTFFGMCLAFDFRFAARDMTITSPYAEVGAPPAGAFGFYLPKYVGQGKTTELLYSGEPISADLALELGLVNELFDTETYQQCCMERCKNLSQQSNQAIKGIRELIHTEIDELEKYMQHSHRIMVRWAESQCRNER